MLKMNKTYYTMKMTQQEINIINEKLNELHILFNLTPKITEVTANISPQKPSPFKSFQVDISCNSTDFDISLFLDWNWVYDMGGSNGKEEYFFYDKESKQWR